MDPPRRNTCLHGGELCCISPRHASTKDYKHSHDFSPASPRPSCVSVTRGQLHGPLTEVGLDKDNPHSCQYSQQILMQTPVGNHTTHTPPENCAMCGPRLAWLWLDLSEVTVGFTASSTADNEARVCRFVPAYLHVFHLMHLLKVSQAILCMISNNNYHIHKKHTHTHMHLHVHACMCKPMDTYILIHPIKLYHILVQYQLINPMHPN